MNVFLELMRTKALLRYLIGVRVLLKREDSPSFPNPPILNNSWVRIMGHAI